MPRVIGIDPGTFSISLCGLDDGQLFLDRSLPTADALATPSLIVNLLESAAPLDLIAGPSGYGLPLIQVQDLTEEDLRLAFLSAAGESGGIHGLTTLMRVLAASSLPVVLTPGVVHLASVPAHRKVNRVDMGTADKVCAAALALSEEASRLGCSPQEVSFILLELGGAFTAGVAVEGGRIVDGVGGSSGPMGPRASGALDGEVACLAGSVSKGMVFRGGVATIASMEAESFDDLVSANTPRARLGWDAYIESAVKAVASLAVSVPGVDTIVLSGRAARVGSIRDGVTTRLSTIMSGVSAHHLIGFATESSHAAQGAALLADGLAGGSSETFINALGVRDAVGTVLDHLHVITPSAARERLGLPE
jgi:predicted butyrate kinase (DUF1464 family)